MKFVLLLCSCLFFMQSCAEDELTTEEFNGSDQTAEAAGGPRGQGGGQGGPGGGPGGQAGDQVASLESTVAESWIDLFLELDRYADGMRPNATARALAYINLAAYETAVPGMEGFISNSNLVRGLRIRGDAVTRNIQWEVALNACYADVMDHFMLNLPTEYRDKIGALESNFQTLLSNDLSDRVVTASENWGSSIASQIIAYSQTDTEAEQQILEPQPLSYEPPVGDGFWTYSAEQERALFPYWESTRTFVISPEETTTVVPIAYSEDQNSPYFDEMVEVYKANNEAREDDGEQLWIAEFWSDDVLNNTFGPPARQFSISNQLIDQRDMNLEEALHLNLKLGFSLNDAAVSTWKYKYQYMVMRPNVFIHEFMDPTYQTNLYRLIPWPNPTFPGYPSGHSCFASAAAGVFIDFFGNRTNFTDRSHEGRTEFRGAPRTFDSFREMAAENGYSRIPLGVHIRMDCTEGLRLGYEISDAINAHRVKRQRG